MRGLDWSNSSYVRLYRHDTATWKRLKWEAQSVYVLMLRHLDRAGCMPLDGLFPHEAVSEMTGIPEEVCERAVKSLESAEFIVVGDGFIADPEFLDRDEASMSGAQRKRDERERRRAGALSGSRFDPSRLATDESRLVTEASRPVTASHEESLHHCLPSLPSEPSDTDFEADPRASSLENLLTDNEKSSLTAIMNETPVDPRDKTSARETDEKAMRTERIYLLASLERRTRSAVGNSDTAFELWYAWRRESRRKGGKTGAADWKNEVKALRCILLPGKTAREILNALSKCRGTWRSFEWDFISKGSGSYGGEQVKKPFRKPPSKAPPIPENLAEWRTEAS